MTRKDLHNVILESDYAYLSNLTEGVCRELMKETIFHMHNSTTLLKLGAIEMGEVMESWVLNKGKYSLQKYLDSENLENDKVFKEFGVANKYLKKFFNKKST